MNIPGFNGFSGNGNATVGRQAPERPAPQPARSREAATPAPAQKATSVAASRPQQVQRTLEHADAALTRRDLPRGSIVDIVC